MDVALLKAVKPGTAALLDQMVTAREAAEEKAAAGENRAVEHVALADEETDALAAAGVGEGGGRSGKPRGGRNRGMGVGVGEKEEGVRGKRQRGEGRGGRSRKVRTDVLEV